MERKAISYAIIRHLARHPGAKDSVRGVVQWCGVSLGVEPPEALVQQILEELQAQGRIASALLVDGTRIYHSPVSQD